MVINILISVYCFIQMNVKDYFPHTPIFPKNTCYHINPILNLISEILHLFLHDSLYNFFCQVLHDFLTSELLYLLLFSGKTTISSPPIVPGHLSHSPDFNLGINFFGMLSLLFSKTGLDNPLTFTHNITIELCTDQLWNFSLTVHYNSPVSLYFPNRQNPKLSDESNCLNH